MIDGHMHLEYGDISVEYVLEFVRQAKVMGISKIQILDHTHRFEEFACIYEELKRIPCQKEWLDKKKLEPLSTYHAVIEEVKALDLDVEVTFGLEVCYVPQHEKYIRQIISQYPYDFVVGAIHSIDGILYDMSFSKELLWDKYDVDYIYKRYYQLIEEVITSDIFSQLAHVDTIKMFNYYPVYNLESTYNHIADLLIKHNVLAENNTGCFYRYGHKDMGLSKELLSLFKQKGVLMITASDAHYPSDVGTNIKDIYEETMK